MCAGGPLIKSPELNIAIRRTSHHSAAAGGMNNETKSRKVPLRYLFMTPRRVPLPPSTTTNTTTHSKTSRSLHSQTSNPKQRSLWLSQSLRSWISPAAHKQPMNTKGKGKARAD